MEGGFIWGENEFSVEPAEGPFQWAGDNVSLKQRGKEESGGSIWGSM